MYAFEPMCDVHHYIHFWKEIDCKNLFWNQKFTKNSSFFKNKWGKHHLFNPKQNICDRLRKTVFGI